LPFPATVGGLLVYAIPLAFALIGEELTTVPSSREG